MQKSGLDFALISFQWFVCLLSSSLLKEVVEIVWDLMFLEGTVVIFRASLAILSILEHDLLKQDQFCDIYEILDTQPKLLVKTPNIIIKQMGKYMNITTKTITTLREKFRGTIMKDQEGIWRENSRSNAPNDNDKSLMKRVKLLFFLFYE